MSGAMARGRLLHAIPHTDFRYGNYSVYKSGRFSLNTGEQGRAAWRFPKELH